MKKNKERKWNNFFAGSLFFFLVFLVSCGGNEIPKPRGYHRIDLPPHTYQSYTGDCPFTFEYHQRAFLVPDKNKENRPCWMNLYYPEQNATIHFSYKPIDGNFNTLLKDAYNLAYKHTVKASNIREELFMVKEHNVSGLMYNIEGNAASPIQFYLTDSSRHFLRGALYFNLAPNADSLQPVTNYLAKDIEKLVSTLRWK